MKFILIIAFLFNPFLLLAQSKFIQFDTTNLDYKIKIYGEADLGAIIIKDTITRAQANGEYSIVLKLKNISKQLLYLPTGGTCWNDVMHISRWGKLELVAPEKTHQIPIKIMYGRDQRRKRVRKTSYIDILDEKRKKVDRITIKLKAFIKDEKKPLNTIPNIKN